MTEMMMNPFTKFDKEWALVTSGTKEKFNSMTISWGSVGTLWFKSIVTIYIRPDRYTFEFLKENDTFTLSFFGEENREALQIMGSRSGRNVDKVEAAGLTPEFLKDGITYKEAKQTIICRKLYMQKMNLDAVPEEARRYYETDADMHHMIIGEVIKVENP
ncbi:MAG: flavin reductase family protein [Eubacteriales bacterium]|nr:flavin reductase family protein [Eubacteriales bacterium]